MKLMWVFVEIRLMSQKYGEKIKKLAHSSLLTSITRWIKNFFQSFSNGVIAHHLQVICSIVDPAQFWTHCFPIFFLDRSCSLGLMYLSLWYKFISMSLAMMVGSLSLVHLMMKLAMLYCIYNFCGSLLVVWFRSTLLQFFFQSPTISL